VLERELLDTTREKDQLLEEIADLEGVRQEHESLREENERLARAIATAQAVSRTPITRNDRKKLWELHEKWKGSFGPRLTRLIVSENERSLFGAYSPSRSEDQQAIANRCQILVHAIWNAFGEGQPEPDVSNLTTFGVRFESVVRQVIALLENGVLKMRQEIQQRQKEPQSQDLSQITEKMGDGGEGKARRRRRQLPNSLITELNRTLAIYSQRLHDEHIELLDRVDQLHGGRGPGSSGHDQ
jgi:hypothetical protein